MNASAWAMLASMSLISLSTSAPTFSSSPFSEAIACAFRLDLMNSTLFLNFWSTGSIDTAAVSIRETISA